MLVPLAEAPGPPDPHSLIVEVTLDLVALRTGHPPKGATFVGLLDDRQCWSLDIDLHGERSVGLEYVDLRHLWQVVDRQTWLAAGRALQLAESTRTHQFCGRCGTPTTQVPGLQARACPQCALLAFPRLAPAVICLVERDGMALLARGAQFAANTYSCLAGFVEPGETLEEAVAREVREEVAIEVDTVRYFASQPWPFPHSLMMGFTARWRSGAIEVDGTEITHAFWFSPEHLPDLPSPMSIARVLIDDWLARSGCEQGAINES
jgi:NAD+ diphosphatase